MIAAVVRVTGYWTAERLAIWASLTPEQRDYDRYQGVYPPGDSTCETAAGRDAIDDRNELLERERDQDAHQCACHLSPPCSHCTDCDECAEAQA